jgi:Tol biopolymer transport system component
MFRSSRSFHCAAALIALCAASLSHAQTAAPAQSTAPPSAQLNEILSSQNRARAIAQVVVSPDGKRIAWLEAGQIRVAPLNDFGNLGNLAHSQPVTAASPGQSCPASNFIWSPDSASIAFLSVCDNLTDQPAQPDLFLSYIDGRPAHRLTELHGYVDAPAFSPDGKSIAFLYVEGATRPSGALAAEPLPSGVIGEDHIEIQRVAVVPADAPQPTVPITVTPQNLHVFEFDWSPDSKSLAYIAADPPGENNWWVAKLYTQTIRATGLFHPTVGAPGPSHLGTGDRTISKPAGAPSESPADLGAPGPSHLGTGDPTDPTPTVVLAPADQSGPLHGLQIAVPRWSPDGKKIAFIGGLMSDQGVTGGDVWAVPSEGGQPIDLTPNRPASAQWITWDDNQSLYVSELSGGDSQLVRLQIPATGAAPAFANGPVFSTPAAVSADESEGSLSATADRSLFVFQASSFNTPPEIFAASRHAGSVRPLCRHCAPLPALSLQRRRQAFLGRFRFALMDQRRLSDSGLALVARALRSGEEVSAPRRGPRRPGLFSYLALGRRSRRLQRHHFFHARLLCPHAQSPRQLRPGRGLHPGQSQGLRIRRPARHTRRRRHRSRQYPSIPTASALPAGAMAAS